jgi:hypothetical protein
MGTVAAIVSWNCREPLRRCLASLREARCAAVVVDNASSDGACGMVAREFPEVALLPQTANLGFAAGTNLAVRRALADGAERVLLLNPDTVLPVETLPALEARLASDPELGAVAPAIVRPDGSAQPYAFGADPSLPYLLRRGANRLFRRRALHDWADPNESAPDWLTGACVLARAEVFSRDGLYLDESYFLYFEDNDWCLRLRRRGWRLLRVPTVRCVHEGGASLGANPAAAGAYRDSLRRFYALHYPAWHGAVLRLLLPVYARLAGGATARSPSA